MVVAYSGGPLTPYELAVDFPIRCLSGCGEVRTLTSISDYQRDGRIITPHCNGPSFGIFVSQQLWHNGIARISYRHDGNYVIFDRDMKLVAEGRVASPEWPEQGLDSDAEELEREYDRRLANALHRPLEVVMLPQRARPQTVNGTASITFQTTDQQRHMNDATRYMQAAANRPRKPNAHGGGATPHSGWTVDSANEYQRQMQLLRELEAEALPSQRMREREARRRMTEADREREQIWRDYWQASEVKLPEKKPEPRRARAVRRRELEKKS